MTKTTKLTKPEANEDTLNLYEKLRTTPIFFRRIIGFLFFVLIALTVVSLNTATNTTASGQTEEETLLDDELVTFEYSEIPQWEVRLMVYQGYQVLKARTILQETNKGITVTLSPEDKVAIDCNEIQKFEKTFIYNETEVLAKITCRKMAV